jgi:hypothetical protein
MTAVLARWARLLFRERIPRWRVEGAVGVFCGAGEAAFDNARNFSAIAVDLR